MLFARYIPENFCDHLSNVVRDNDQTIYIAISPFLHRQFLQNFE